MVLTLENWSSKSVNIFASENTKNFVKHILLKYRTYVTYGNLSEEFHLLVLVLTLEQFVSEFSKHFYKTTK